MNTFQGCKWYQKSIYTEETQFCSFATLLSFLIFALFINKFFFKKSSPPQAFLHKLMTNCGVSNVNHPQSVISKGTNQRRHRLGSNGTIEVGVWQFEWSPVSPPCVVSACWFFKAELQMIWHYGGMTGSRSSKFTSRSKQKHISCNFRPWRGLSPSIINGIQPAAEVLEKGTEDWKYCENITPRGFAWNQSTT